MTTPIDTGRLRLIACDGAIYDALLSGKKALTALLGIDVPTHWTSFGKAPIQYAYDRWQLDPGEAGWWLYLPVYKPENRLIGTGGYKGKPDKDGLVEIGYEISKSYRRRGLGLEFANGLVTNAFADRRVRIVQAHTLAQENPSAKLLRQLGMRKVDELTDADDGFIWRWQLNQPLAPA